MALGLYQKITRVIPGRPFGNGSDGAYSSATIPTMVTVSLATVASGETNITVSASTLSDGDVILIHQSRGTGVGQMEINRVVSGGGTTSIVLQKNLQYTYTDSGNSQAQATVIKQYTDVTVESGTWTTPSWNANTGGIFIFAAKGTTTITGTTAANGVTGTANTRSGGSGGAIGGGFYGGNIGGEPFSSKSWTGVGHTGISLNVVAQGVNQGSGGSWTWGGGGHGAGNFTTGGYASQGATPGSGYPGSLSGNADLTSITFGGGGGGGYCANENESKAGGGGSGGGIVIIITKTLIINPSTGYLLANGGSGGAGTTTDWNNFPAGGGGAGAGGSILIQCASGTFETERITAIGGSGGAAPNRLGGTGSVGRIAVHHSGIITGTTNPGLVVGVNDITDPSLVETDAAFLFNMV